MSNRWKELVLTGIFAAATMSGPLKALASDTEPAGQGTNHVACDGSQDIQLSNGKILTMDGKNSVASSVNIKRGRIVAVGNTGDRSVTPCTRRIDLGGRTAIPGIIDSHLHIVALGRRPGFDTPLDTARSIADVLRLIHDRAQAHACRRIRDLSCRVDRASISRKAAAHDG